MSITEAHPGPRGWTLWRENAGKGTHPGFPFADGRRFYSDPRFSCFFAYNNAVPRLLGLCFGSPREPKCLEAPKNADPRTIDGAVQAWKHASTTEHGHSRFGTIRRLHGPSADLLGAYAESLEQHSMFLSYRWADHDESCSEGREALERLRTLSERLAEERLGVWLDRLMLPESKLKERQGKHVLKKILADGIKRAKLLLAVVTRRYGGPSAGGKVEPGYTADEWKRARCKRRVRWEVENSAFEHELGGRISARLGPNDCPEGVALATRGQLP
jgi:hypothetical protein